MPDYTDTDLSTVFTTLGITKKEFSSDDVFFIVPSGNTRAQYDPYLICRLPSWYPERKSRWASWINGELDNKSVTPPTPGQATAYFSIPFYNRTRDDIQHEPKPAGFTGPVYPPGTIQLIPDVAPSGQQKLSLHKQLMWQPNLSGKIITYFSQINVDTMNSTPFSNAYNWCAGYWINLHSIRDCSNDPQFDANAAGAQRLTNVAFKNPLIPDDLTHAYLISTHDSDYSIHVLDQTYWSQMPQIYLSSNDPSQNSLVDYMVTGTNHTQVATLGELEAEAIGIADHGLCYVINLASLPTS